MPKKNYKPTLEHRKNLSLAHKGMKKPWAGKCERTLPTRLKMSLTHKGDKHWNWQGGKSSEIARLRDSIEYEDWRKSVFIRDNYTCQKCSSKGYIHAHHIKRFNNYLELRFDIDNGITLCVFCHSKTNGHQGMLTKFTKQKIREALLGRIVSTKTRKKMSEAKKGKVPWNKGLKIKPMSKKICSFCLEVFTPTRKKQIYCCKRCSNCVNGRQPKRLIENKHTKTNVNL